MSQIPSEEIKHVFAGAREILGESKKGESRAIRKVPIEDLDEADLILMELEVIADLMNPDEDYYPSRDHLSCVLNNIFNRLSETLNRSVKEHQRENGIMEA